MTKLFRLGGGLAVVLGALALCAGPASANPIEMPTLAKEIQHDKAAGAIITPPAPPCPQYSAGLSCTPVPETPATGIPFPGNMAYYGGPVQTHANIYLVYWGWGQSGAWKSGTNCTSETLSEGSNTATLACDPDGAGKYMADFVNQMGGTPWADVANQYYETDSSGQQVNVNDDHNVLAGIWVDDSNPAQPMASSNSSNPAGPTNTLTLMAQEADRAAAHFGVSGSALTNANFVILQPPGFSDPNALSSGYCAFHDYTQPAIEGGVYNGVTPGLVYTNMPYILLLGTGCGQDSVNPAPQGNLDGLSVVLGHEIMEAITDPGAEDVVGSSPTYLGGWYDTFDGNENGDKCAWVGNSLLANPTDGSTTQIPGAIGDIKGSGGETFAVQSTWSNRANEGTGYCEGVNNSPIPNGS